jgi:inosine-uridine nucleoside N-ribohydrolase
MTRKLVLDLDPGIGDAIAALVALADPQIELLALTATAGSTSAAVATQAVQALVQLADPPRWPRIGAAIEADPPDLACEEFMRLQAELQGPSGLGELRPTVPELHSRRESPRLLVELVREFPHEVTLVTLGPLTNLAAACDRAPEFLSLLAGLVIVGGAGREGGDVTATAEFNMARDPAAARRVLATDEVRTLIPLDATSPLGLTSEDCQLLMAGPGPLCELLRKLLPFSLRQHHDVLGMECVPIREAAAVALVSRPYLFQSSRIAVEVEVAGELTRGMTVFDQRTGPLAHGTANTNVVTEIDEAGLVAYLSGLFTARPA